MWGVVLGLTAGQNRRLRQAARSASAHRYMYTARSERCVAQVGLGRLWAAAETLLQQGCRPSRVRAWQEVLLCCFWGMCISAQVGVKQNFAAALGWKNKTLAQGRHCACFKQHVMQLTQAAVTLHLTANMHVCSIAWPYNHEVHTMMSLALHL